MKNLKDYKQYWDKDFKTWFERNIKESTKENWEKKFREKFEAKHQGNDMIMRGLGVFKDMGKFSSVIAFIKSQKELSFKKGVEKGRLLANSIRINNLKKDLTK